VPEPSLHDTTRCSDPAALRSAGVTVVTVCRNAGALLEQAIASVAALQRPDVAHVVIDGASSDGTLAYLRAMPWRIAHWQSEPDTGIYDAMNKGWALAGADSYVLFLGADDRLLSLPSAAELSQARARAAVLIYGDANIGDTPFVSRYTEELRNGNTLHHQALLVDKRVHPQSPFDLRLRVYGDWDFNLRLWKQGVRAEYLPSLRSQVGPGGVSSSLPLGETLRVVNRHSGPWRAGFLLCWIAKKQLGALIGRLRSGGGPQRDGR
jgi:glycosyltransferase involved in cell wall biosynthesis